MHIFREYTKQKDCVLNYIHRVPLGGEMGCKPIGVGSIPTLVSI